MAKNFYQARLTDYEGFEDKFKPKKTTDDCYTPEPVYNTILDYINEKIIPLEGHDIIRPFYPGNDYTRFEYPENCIVIDNPPFSIYSKIVRWYLQHGIKFFLFCPSLTQPVVGADVCYIVTGADICYANGAHVATSFTTNLIEKVRIRVCGELNQRIAEVQKQDSKSVAKLVLPDCVTTCARLQKYAKEGRNFDIYATECGEVRKLTNYPQSLFGLGFMLSDRATAMLDRESGEGQKIELTEKEKAMQQYLNMNKNITKYQTNQNLPFNKNF